MIREINSLDKEWEEYYKRKEDYLLNKKPERYKLLCIGEGFIIYDTLNHYDDDSNYMLIPDMFGETDKGYRVDKNYLTPEDLVDNLNFLDFQVNGGLYDDYYHILSNKNWIHTNLINQVDMILNTMSMKDTISFSFYDYTNNPNDVIDCKIQLSKHKLGDYEENPISNNLIFKIFFRIINEYIDELDDNDVLIELKMRILEYFQKNPMWFMENL